MQFVDALVGPRSGSASPVSDSSRPAASPGAIAGDREEARPPGSAAASAARSTFPLRELIATANAAASISPDDDHAIWEDACRRIATQNHPARVRTAPGSGPRTVLVADDTPAWRETMQQALTAGGYAVAAAADGATALTLARGHCFDLMVLALDLPGSDGTSLVSRLRELPAHRHTPVMMLVTPAHEAKKLALRRAGASGWILKPFEPSRFVAIVQQVCPGQ